MIENLEQFRGTRVHPFPTKPKKRLGVAVRIDGILTAVDAAGRIYSTRVSSSRPTTIARMGPSSRRIMAAALERLELLAPKVLEEQAAESDREDKRDTARALLCWKREMEELGVPFTASQLKRLEALAQ
jgi:hypothetical protein